jgi:hypothetical protein
MSTQNTSSVHNFSWADEFFSPERLRSYLDGFGGSYPLALNAYATDLKALGEVALWINLLEIALRNAFTRQIRKHLTGTSGEWFLDIEPLLTSKSKEALAIARKRISKNGGQVTGSTMTAALPFGFWVNLMGRRHEASLWTPALRLAFPNLRRPNRSFVNGRLLEIYRLRNHVAHQGLISAGEMSVAKKLISEVLSWISIEGHEWANANAPSIT